MVISVFYVEYIHVLLKLLVVVMTDASVYLSDDPPLHYTLKVNPFSELSNLLSKTGTAKYDSCDFESGGYKW